MRDHAPTFGAASPSCYDFNTCDKAQIVHGQLRPGVTMHGVFATRHIRNGEFICAWTGIMCDDTV